MANSHTDQWLRDMNTQAQAAQQQKVSALAEPVKPGYQQLQTMGDKFRVDAGPGIQGQLRKDLTGASEVAEQMRARAMATPGSSPWEQMMMQRQGVEQGRAMDEAKQRSASEGAGAMGQLGMRGGLGSGARERVAQGAARGLNLASAGVSQAGALQRANIGVQGEEQRLNMMPQAVNAGLNLGQAFGTAGASDRTARMGAEQTNISNSMEQQRRQNLFDLEKYKTEMEKWAAERQAQAEENAGKK